MELEANGGYLRDSATEIPEDYSKVDKRASFLSTKPQLCWETEDNSKQRVMREMRLTDDYNVNQLKDYFDMSSSGDESDAERNRELLLGDDGQELGEEGLEEAGEEDAEEDAEADVMADIADLLEEKPAVKDKKTLQFTPIFNNEKAQREVKKSQETPFQQFIRLNANNRHWEFREQ